VNVPAKFEVRSFTRCIGFYQPCYKQTWTRNIVTKLMHTPRGLFSHLFLRSFSLAPFSSHRKSASYPPREISLQSPVTCQSQQWIG